MINYIATLNVRENCLTFLCCFHLFVPQALSGKDAVCINLFSLVSRLSLIESKT